MDFPPTTIIGTPISHYVQTVIFACEEAGLPYTLKIEGHDTRDALRQPEHRQWHPFSRIPAIEIGEVTLYETSAICRYIDQVFNASSLVPREPLEAARMELWISAINCYYHIPCISHLVSQYVFPGGPNGRPDQEVIESSLPKVRHAMQQLAAAYDKNPYLAGGNLTLADLFIVPILMQMRQTPEGRDCIASFPTIEEGLGRVSERPAFRKVVELHSAHLPGSHLLRT